jgi:hypothetical protein
MPVVIKVINTVSDFVFEILYILLLTVRPLGYEHSLIADIKNYKVL